MEEYAEKYSNVSVLTGPVFDYDADGKMDDPSNIPMLVRNVKNI